MSYPFAKIDGAQAGEFARMAGEVGRRIAVRSWRALVWSWRALVWSWRALVWSWRALVWSWRALVWSWRALVWSWRALVWSWPVVKFVYRVGFWLAVWLLVVLIYWRAVVDRDTFGPAVMNFGSDLHTLSLLLAGYLGEVAGFTVRALMSLPSYLGVSAGALLLSYLVYGAKRAFGNKQ